MRKILVTRPLEDYQRSANKIAQMGFEAVHAPMMRFKNLAAEMPSRNAISALIFTSANGIRAILALKEIEQFKKLPCYVVGAQTAQMANEHGFEVWAQGDGDVQSFVKVIEVDYSERKRVGDLLHISGVHQAGNLSRALTQLSIANQRIQAYEMIEIDRLTPDIVAAFSAHEISAILLYSTRSAEILIKNLKKHNILQKISDIPTYCLSYGIASDACKPYLDKVYWAEKPNEAALLKLMQDDLKN